MKKLHAAIVAGIVAVTLVAGTLISKINSGPKFKIGDCFEVMGQGLPLKFQVVGIQEERYVLEGLMIFLIPMPINATALIEEVDKDPNVVAGECEKLFPKLPVTPEEPDEKDSEQPDSDVTPSE